MSEQFKRVRFIFTGGTLAGNVAKSGSHQDNQNLNSDEILHSFLAPAVEVVQKTWGVRIESSAVDLFNKDSSNINPEDWTALVDEIKSSYDEADSFVIIHGTNTMAYTAAALSFALGNVNKPVIITGAQVPLGYLGSDATTNMVNALRLAVWNFHEVKGVMVVFGSRIISGVRAKKGTDFDYDPFSSFQTGSLGQIGRFMKVDDAAMDKYISYLSKKNPPALHSSMLSIAPHFATEKIASLTEFPGMNSDLLVSLADSGNMNALILRSFGAGDPNQNLFAGLEYLKQKRIPVVVTTQAPGGVSNFQVNESGQYLKENNLAIPAYDMSIEAITVKLGWLLGQEVPYEQIHDRMLEDLHGEINVHIELV
jgi:L-asparaginase